MNKPWYRTFGPIDWYRNPYSGQLEWLRLTLSWRHMLFLHLTIWCWHAWHLALLGRVLERSRYGRPSVYSSTFSLPEYPRERS